MIIEIELNSLSDIPGSFKDAIKKYKDQIETQENSSCIWGATIKLKEIKFQDNFRRQEYTAIFEVLND